MSDDALFGELRSLLQQAPSSAAWRALCEQLDRWPHDALEAVAIPYAADHLKRWDADIKRAMPEAWGHKVLGGQTALLRLVNEIDARVIPTADDTRATLEAIASRRDLDQLAKLDLSGMHIESGARDALAAAWLPGLRELSLYSAQLHDAAALLGAPLMQGLTLLELSYNHLSAADVAALRAPKLTWLGLNHNYLSDEGVRALVDALADCPLDSLGLAGCSVGHGGAAALGRSRVLGELRVLYLNEDPLKDAGVEALLERERLPALEYLELSDTQIGQRACAALGAHPGFESIHALTLSKNERIDDAALAALISGGGLEQLYRLDLRGCAITDAGAIALAETDQLAGLTSLDLSKNAVGDAGLYALIASERLDALDLSSPLLTDDGLRAIAQLPALAELTWLGLRSPHISAAGAAALADSPHIGEGMRERWRDWSPW